MNKKIESEQYFKIRQKLNKKIPFKYKRQSSLERKYFRIKKKSDSIKKEGAISYNTYLNIDNFNPKSSLDILMTQKNSQKRFSPKNKKSNSSNNKHIKKEKSPNKKENKKNIKNIIMILEKKEKTKTFNRKVSNPNLKVNINNNNNHSIYNNKKNNLFRVKSGAFKLNKQKMLNQKKISYNNINNKTNIEKKIMNNHKHIINLLENTPKNNKRNTDSIIQIKNKEKNDDAIKIKNSKNNININKKYKNKIGIIIKKPKKSLKKSKNNLNPRKRNLSPISIINNNNSNDISIVKKYKYNNFENPLIQKKIRDINLDYQENQKYQNIDFNNTTSRIKLKINGLITNIEMDKDKEFQLLTENNSISQTKSKGKKNNKYMLKKSKFNLKNKKIIINNTKHINEKNLPLFIRKCCSVNSKKKINFNEKETINEKHSKNLTEHNKNENNNIDEFSNQLEETININDIYNTNKINKDKENKNDNNNINKKNSLNMNAENSFTTIKFYNSNIDEKNYNESKKNFVHMPKINNFTSNRKNISKNYNIINIIDNNIINYDKNENYNENILNNEIESRNQYKNEPNKKIKAIIQSIPIKDYKNNYNNLPINNNFNNCNTENTSDKKQINNKNKINESEGLNKNKILNENKKKKFFDEKKKDFSDKKQFYNSKDNDAILNKNEIACNREILKNKILKQIEDKDFLLDKSISLRMFPVVHEDFIEKEDEVIKLFNFQSQKDSNKDINFFPISNNEEESDIIFQTSEYSKEISLLVNNDFSKYNKLINNKNNKNIYQNIFNINNNYNFVNIQNQNINIDNAGLKDTSIISNIGIKGCKSITQGGKERTGHRKKNQDFYILEKNINNILGFNLFAILDGHGVNGHLVSQFASKLLLKKFINILNTNKFNDTESIYNFLKKSDFQKIIDIFLETDNQIMEQKGFDISLSGTTCCLVIQLYEHIICSNIGDSRGIIIFDENKIFELSNDSKPEVPEETKRINLMGGVVDQIKNEDGEKSGPYRVYIKNTDLPGLAMSRSFGDKKAKSCGVIPYPDIIEYTLNNDSKYMVICSDGVWDFLSNEDVMKIGNKYYGQNNINEFCSQLLRISTEMWETKENYIDDITIVAIFF